MAWPKAVHHRTSTGSPEVEGVLALVPAPEDALPLLSSGLSLPPQAAKLIVMASARTMDKTFFILMLLFQFFIKSLFAFYNIRIGLSPSGRRLSCP